MSENGGNGNGLPVLTAKDFASDQEVRWCPGCGDYAILAAAHHVPLRGEGGRGVIRLTPHRGVGRLWCRLGDGSYRQTCRSDVGGLGDRSQGSDS